MLQLYIDLASSRLACRDIQRIQRIQRIQLYSYTRYTAYSPIQPPSEPWCVEVSRVSGGVGRCRGSVEAVSVDTGVGVSGSVGLQCRGSVGAP